MKWYSFDPARGSRQKRPPINKAVLVFIPGNEQDGRADAIAVGYRKNAAGDKQCPYFVTPGGNRDGRVAGWCDINLPDVMELWKLAREAKKPGAKK